MGDLNPSTAAAEVVPATDAGIVKVLQRQHNDSRKWNYAGAAGGITDTTAVTIKDAAGAGKKNYLKSIQFSNSGAAGSEFQIKKGAGGTVIFTGYVGAAAPQGQVTFDPPLESDANQLLEVKLAAGVTMLFRFNAQGFTD